LPGTPEWCEWSNETVNDVRQPPGIPVLLSPADETVTTTQAITFTWQAGAGETPDGYNLKLEEQVMTTTDTTSSTVLSLGVHMWTVRAYNSAGTADWASARTGEVVPPPPGVPTLLFPPDETVTTTQAITFAWQSGAGGTPDGYNLKLDGEVMTTTATSLSSILPLGMHSWTVRAYNAGGYSDWAGAQSLEVVPPPPGIPTLLLPPDEAVTTTQTIAFSWQEGSGGIPAGYNLKIDGEVLTTTATTLSTELSIGLHSWTVRAYNVSGYSDWASARTVERISYWVYLPVIQRNHP